MTPNWIAVFKDHTTSRRAGPSRQLDATMCRAIGRAMARFAGATELLIARDIRASGVELSQAFSEGCAPKG